MTQQNEFQNKPIHSISFVKPMFLGAGIALLVISSFIFGFDAPKPEWGKFWMIRPLIVTPLVGAMGGAFYVFMNYQAARGFNRTLAIILSILVYFIALWLGIVLGLAGTLWD